MYLTVILRKTLFLQNKSKLVITWPKLLRVPMANCNLYFKKGVNSAQYGPT